MNTSSMIPISYVKSITPLVMGDVVMTKGGAIVTINSGGEDWNETDKADDLWWLKSFADRPNTGKQPVGDDLFVDVVTGVNNPRPADASDFQYWWTDGTIKTWKPNHAAMLADYKKTQEPKEQRCGDEHPIRPIHDPDSYMHREEQIGSYVPTKISLFTPEAAAKETLKNLDYTYNGGQLWKPPIGKIPSFIADKPVFTQAMKDAGELPPIGCEVEYNTASRGDVIGVVTGYRTSKSLNTLADNCDYQVSVKFEHNERLLKDIKPIDTKSDKQKAIDGYWDSMKHGTKVMTFKERVKLAFKAGIDWVGE